MALTDKKYEKFYETTGSGTDKIDSSKLTEIEATWNADKTKGCQEYLNDPFLGPLIFQLQQMQDEIDYLRTEISSNKDKTTFPGFGTSNSTALVGDTKLISIGSNTTVSFGDMVIGARSLTITMTVVYTDPSSGKVTTATHKLTLS
tara:strand:- start:681 stop:1118 length:438 start_codon:yes stop_codon:yes gene_type:complete